MTELALGRIFVIGGTDLLAPAIHWIARRASAITLAGRAPEDLSTDIGATPLRLDWKAGALVRRALAARRGRFDMAIIWLDDDLSALARPAEDVVRRGGRVIRIHGTATSDPVQRRLRDPDPRGDVTRQVLIVAPAPDPRSRAAPCPPSDVEISGGLIATLREPSLALLSLPELGITSPGSAPARNAG